MTAQLELRQRGLLDLIKGRQSVPRDDYLDRIANSRELGMVRQIALWWRAFELEARCAFSARVLKRLGRFDTLVAAYFDSNATSPFAEELSLGFLRFLEADKDPLVRAVSLFERALLLVRAGSPIAFEVLWDRNPDLVIRSLMDGSEIPGSEPESLYRMQIARDLPRLVTCTRESQL